MSHPHRPAPAAPTSPPRRRSVAALLGGLVVAGALAPAAAHAQPAVGVPAATAPDRAPDAPDAGPVGRRLVVHGFFTQAAGISRGGQLYGIPNAGTADLRRAALLATVHFSADDRMVVQVAHRRVGDAPRAALLPDVKVDWLFWQHALGDATQLRVGRFAVPYGIFAETRYVGTQLPFFSAPAAFYRESDFTNEALDGVSLRRELLGDSPFPVEVTAYAGQLDYAESFTLPFGPAGSWITATAPASARRVAGVLAWVGTPIPGLRVGGGAARAELRGGTRPAARRDTMFTWSASIDGAFDRVTARAELLGADMSALHARSGYVQLGVRPWRPLWVNAQLERTRGRIRGVPVPPTFQPVTLPVEQLRDAAVGAVWTLGTGVQVRAEAHRVRGYAVEEDGVSLLAPPRRGRYVLLGVAVAF